MGLTADLREVGRIRYRVVDDDSGLVEEYPNLSAYVARGVARPAYQRAFAAQLAVFNASGAG